MSKQDYIKQATEKIYSVAASQMVAEELESHIDEKADLYEKRCVPPDTAAQRALEDMGDAALVADSFGKIHNASYNPIWDILTLVLHLGALGGGWYAIHTYAEKDAGLFPVLLATAVFSLSLMLADEAVCLARRQLVPSLLSLVRLAGTAGFLYYDFGVIDKAVNGDMALLARRIVTPLLSESAAHYRQPVVLAAVAVLTVLLSVGIIIALVWEIKTRMLTIKNRHNRLRRSALRVTRYLAVLLVAITVVLGVKLYTDYRHYQTEYVKAYQTALELLEQCETQEQVDAFIKSSKLPFEIAYDSAGEPSGYEYKSNYTRLTVNYLFQEKPDINSLEDALIASMRLDDSDYLYEVNFGADTDLFENGADALTVRWLCFEDEDILRFHSVDFAAMTLEEEYAYYHQYVPMNYTAAWTLVEAWDKTATFDYMFGKGQFKYRQICHINFPSELHLWAEKKIAETVKIIKENPDADSETIASMTGTEITYHTVDFADYFDKYDLALLAGDDIGETVPLYYFDNGVFFLYFNGRYVHYLSFYKDDDLLAIETLDQYDATGQRAYGKYTEQDSRTEQDAFRKVSCRGYYYDREGRCYDNVRYVPYFTRDGRVFWFYSDITHTESKDEYDIKNYYLTDRKELFYDARQCYVDENGYLVFDTNNSFRKGEGEYCVTPSGKQVTRALYTSWDNEGNILPFDKEYQDEVTL